jgi:hypothetical protein
MDPCQFQYRQSAVHKEGAECSDLLDCYAVLTGKYLPTFRGEACRPHIQDQTVVLDNNSMNLAATNSSAALRTPNVTKCFILSYENSWIDV